MATLTAEPRQQTSSNATNRLRKTGVLPMALIRKSNETQLIQAPNEAIRACIQGQSGLAIFDLKHEGSKLRVVVKDMQRDPVTRRVTHITLQEVLDTDVVKVPIPIKIVGEPLSVTKRASILMVPMAHLMVHSMVKSLPDAIFVDVSHMQQGDKISVGDLEWAEGVTPLASPETVLATTKQLRGMTSLEDEGAVETDTPKAEEAGASA